MDWTTSFQALTDEARASYRYVLSEWQELLTKVARGDVAPSVLEDRLPQFLQDEGADFYRRLSALSFELFNGLSELQAGTTTEFIRGLLGDSAIVESPAPSAPRRTGPPGSRRTPLFGRGCARALTTSASSNAGTHRTSPIRLAGNTKRRTAMLSQRQVKVCNVMRGPWRTACSNRSDRNSQRQAHVQRRYRQY